MTQEAAGKEYGVSQFAVWTIASGKPGSMFLNQRGATCSRQATPAARSSSSSSQGMLIFMICFTNRLFSRRLACIECGVSMPEMTPRAFSFNSPHGACPECQGLGAKHDFDPQRIVPDRPNRCSRAPSPRGQGATGNSCGRPSSASAGTWVQSREPFAQPPANKVRDQILGGGNGKGFEGIIPNLRRRFEGGVVDRAGGPRSRIARSVRARCATASGLKPQSLAVKVKGRTKSGVHGPANQRSATRCSTGWS